MPLADTSTPAQGWGPCRCPLCWQLGPPLCCAGPSVPPSLQRVGLRGEIPTEGSAGLCVHIWLQEHCLGASKSQSPCTVMLALLLPPHTPPHQQAAAMGWVLPWGRAGMQGMRLDGAASGAGEALISAAQIQPYIFISSPVILIFSVLERASRGPHFERKS